MRLVKLTDLSLATGKRYEGYFIGIPRDEEVEDLVELVRGMNYYRNKYTRQAWEGRKASQVWLYFAESLEDHRNAKYNKKVTFKEGRTPAVLIH